MIPPNDFNDKMMKGIEMIVSKIGDLKDIKVGQTAVYHVGDLSNDRFDKEFVNGEREFTNDAKHLNKLASYLLDNSNKYELKQHKIRTSCFQYQAKRLG